MRSSLAVGTGMGCVGLRTRSAPLLGLETVKTGDRGRVIAFIAWGRDIVGPCIAQLQNEA